MKKIILSIIFTVLLVFPVVVNADICSNCPIGLENVEPWLDSKSYLKEKNGDKYIEIPAAGLPTDTQAFDPNSVEPNHVELNFIRYLLNDDDSIWFKSIDLQNKTITVNIGYKVQTEHICPDENNSLLGSKQSGMLGDSGPVEPCDPSEPWYIGESIERTYPYEFKPGYNQEDLTKANSIISGIDDSYTISDLETINMSYNYGRVNYFMAIRDGLYSDPNMKKSSEDILNCFQPIKNIMNNNQEFDYHLSLVNYQSRVDNISETAELQLIVMKNNIALATKSIKLINNYYFFVDKDATGTVKDKTEQRLENYFGNKKFYIKQFDTTEKYDDNGTELPLTGFYLYFEKDSDMIHDNYNWCDKNEPYCIESPFIKTQQTNHLLGDISKPFYFTLFVAEVNGDKVKELNISAMDNKTGILVNTGSYDVPLDVQVNANSKSNDNSIIELLKQYDYKMIDAYNIEIYGGSEGNKITSIENGIEVYIPIEGYKEGDTITIKHIKDDGTLGETLEGTVVKKDGKLYAKFLTTHFSTFALVSSSVTNPPTGDNLITNIILFIISISGIIMICFYNRKEKRL